MLDKINGLPAHVLLVHVVVVLVPLAALFAVLAVAWPAARRRLGILAPLTALVAVLFVPVTTSAGEWLQEHVAETPLVQRHVELGDGLLPVAGLLFVFAAVFWLLDAAPARNWRLPAFLVTRAARGVVSALVVVLAVLSVVQVYRIGDSGAKAAWKGNFSATATSHGEDG